MFCQKCGSEIENDAVFCTNCGKAVEAEQKSPEMSEFVDTKPAQEQTKSEQSQIQPIEKKTDEKPEAPNLKKKSNLPLIIVSGLCVLLIGGGVTFWILNGKNDSDTASNITAEVSSVQSIVPETSNVDTYSSQTISSTGNFGDDINLDADEVEKIQIFLGKLSIGTFGDVFAGFTDEQIHYLMLSQTFFSNRDSWDNQNGFQHLPKALVEQEIFDFFGKTAEPSIVHDTGEFLFSDGYYVMSPGDDFKMQAKYVKGRLLDNDMYWIECEAFMSDIDGASELKLTATLQKNPESKYGFNLISLKNEN